MKKIVSATLVFIFVLLFACGFAGCSSKYDDYKKVSLNSSFLYSSDENTTKYISSVELSSTLTALDGQGVYVNGYMHSDSPLDGSYIMLVPRQDSTCPFCAGVANVGMPVSDKNGKSTDLKNMVAGRKYRVYGTLETGTTTVASVQFPFMLYVEKIEAL